MFELIKLENQNVNGLVSYGIYGIWVTIIVICFKQSVLDKVE